MAETTRQTLQTKLAQRLTPMQVQFVRLLEMTTPQLEDEVRNAVSDNPALDATDHPVEDIIADTATDSERDDSDSYDSDDVPRPGRNSNSIFEHFTASEDEDSLYSHLEKQLGEMDLDPDIYKIALYIAGNIDGNGRLTRTPYELATDLAVNADIYADRSQIAEAFDIVRSLDPAGVGFIDLRDCLLLQLARMEQTPDVRNADEIIRHYYDLYSNKRYDRLRMASGLDADEIRRAEQIILSLNPKPGAQFENSRMDSAASVIVPDFQVDVDNDIITVSLTSSLPDLAISESFRIGSEDALPDAGNKRAEAARAFIRHHRDEAQLFIKLIKMRNDTLLRTMTAITRLQREFFLTDDPEKIRPMVLRDIADMTGLDLSVISRATSGKYVATRNGIYPLKMFFSEKSSADEEDGSIHRVLSVLRSVIDEEDKSHPLSDEAIKDEMKARGFDLARRTVAKYREEKLNIPVARLRKKV